MANKRTYRFGKSLLTLEFGDITTSKAQVLVSSDDYYLSMGGGVSLSIMKAGGHAIALDAAKKVPAAVGDVVVTTAGTLAAQYIFHAITIGPDDLSISPKEIIKQATRRCMQMLDTLQLSSIAFPAIGTGSAGFSSEDAAVQMSAIISEDLLKRRSPVEVTMYLFDRSGQKKEIDYIDFFEEVAARVPRLTSQIVAPETKAPGEQTRPLHDMVPTSDDVPKTDEQIRMRRLNNLRKLIGSIEDRRFEIEARLIDILNTGQEKEIRKLRHKLAENQELRLGYLNELKSFSEKDSVTPQQADSLKKHRSVFVSSTYRDLIAHRAAVKDQIIRRDMLFRGEWRTSVLILIEQRPQQKSWRKFAKLMYILVSWECVMAISIKQPAFP
jgi:O-acetyl-ADP-ribose deacetylase (regulator of RNase III)